MHIVKPDEEKKIILLKPTLDGPGLPLADYYIHAGFPSPGADSESDRISLDQHVTQHPHATYCSRVWGDCMNGSGIHENDVVVISRYYPKPLQGDVIVGHIHGEFVMGAYMETRSGTYLVSDNKAYDPIRIDGFADFILFGIVTHTVLNLRKQSYVRAHRLQQFLRLL